MINKIDLQNFKAYKNLQLNLENRNLLIYGDNGAGKSSLYEALKLTFFKNRIESENIEDSSILQEYENNKQSFYKSFNNTIIKQDFIININENKFSEFSADNYNAFMFCIDDLITKKEFNLHDILNKLYFNIPDNFILDKYFKIQLRVNNFIKFCLEDFEIIIDNQNEYNIKIFYEKKFEVFNLNDKLELLNEAKINLIILGVYFAIIQLLENKNKYNILILDDFITSLDTANRTFIMRYLLDNFTENFQIFIFTHNIYFYNLITFLIEENYNSKKWHFGNLYEIHDEHKIILKNNIKRCEDIKKEYLESNDLKEIGNKIRQRFEILLYELSKHLIVGGVEDSNKILNSIINKNRFYKNGKKDSNNLIEEIEEILNDNNALTHMKTRINKKISQYKIEKLDNINYILKTLKLYRKVSLHQLSHGQLGETNFTKKEIEESLKLLFQLEENLKDISSKSN